MLVSSGAILFISWRGFKGKGKGEGWFKGRVNAEGLRVGQGEMQREVLRVKAKAG